MILDVLIKRMPYVYLFCLLIESFRTVCIYNVYCISNEVLLHMPTEERPKPITMFHEDQSSSQGALPNGDRTGRRQEPIGGNMGTDRAPPHTPPSGSGRPLPDVPSNTPPPRPPAASYVNESENVYKNEAPSPRAAAITSLSPSQRSHDTARQAQQVNSYEGGDNYYEGASNSTRQPPTQTKKNAHVQDNLYEEENAAAVPSATNIPEQQSRVAPTQQPQNQLPQQQQQQAPVTNTFISQQQVSNVAQNEQAQLQQQRNTTSRQAPKEHIYETDNNYEDIEKRGGNMYEDVVASKVGHLYEDVHQDSNGGSNSHRYDMVPNEYEEENRVFPSQQNGSAPMSPQVRPEISLTSLT